MPYSQNSHIEKCIPICRLQNQETESLQWPIVHSLLNCIPVFTEEAKEQNNPSAQFFPCVYLFSLLQMVSLETKRHYFHKDHLGQFYSVVKVITEEMFALASPSLLVTVSGELLCNPAVFQQQNSAFPELNFKGGIFYKESQHINIVRGQKSCPSFLALESLYSSSKGSLSRLSKKRGTT